MVDGFEAGVGGPQIGRACRHGILQRRPVGRNPRFPPGEAGGHAVDVGHQQSEFVARGDGEPGVEGAVADGARGPADLLDPRQGRPGDAAVEDRQQHESRRHRGGGGQTQALRQRPGLLGAEGHAAPFGLDQEGQGLAGHGAEAVERPLDGVLAPLRIGLAADQRHLPVQDGAGRAQLGHGARTGGVLHPVGRVVARREALGERLIHGGQGAVGIVSGDRHRLGLAVGIADGLHGRHAELGEAARQLGQKFQATLGLEGAVDGPFRRPDRRQRGRGRQHHDDGGAPEQQGEADLQRAHRGRRAVNAGPSMSPSGR